MSDELIEIRQREEVAKRKVLHFSLLAASENWNDDEADPGWQSEMYDDLLRDAIVEASEAVIARRVAEGKHESAA